MIRSITETAFAAAGKRRRLPLAMIALGGLLLSPPATAEILYVTDILRLGLYANSDTSGEPFRILASGDALDVLQRTTYYARVRTDDGAEGWVKASYLIDEKPAQARLTELTEERDRLSAELTNLRDRLVQNDNELASAQSDRNMLEQKSAALTDELGALRVDNKILSEKVSALRFSIPLRWLLGIAALTLVGGFLGGWWWTDARQRKRHGGFRI